MTSPPPASPAFEVAAHSGGDAKRSYVRSMFAAIAPRYDLLNHVLSLNVDLCAGTLDLAATLARARGFRGTVLGADFVIPMLVQGKGKAPRTRRVGADALTLPFADARFDGAMVAFGVRNLADLDAGLREAHRVLRPGARFVVLEFTTPRFAPLRALYLFYFRRILPAIGRAVSKHRDAYTYLPESVLDFPEPDALARRLEGAGFSHVGYEVLTGGICAVHHGTR